MNRRRQQLVAEHVAEPSQLRRQRLIPSLTAARVIFFSSSMTRRRRQDSREYRASGKPLYDPARISVPVLIVHADLDRDCPIEL